MTYVAGTQITGSPGLQKNDTTFLLQKPDSSKLLVHGLKQSTRQYGVQISYCIIYEYQYYTVGHIIVEERGKCLYISTSYG